MFDRINQQHWISLPRETREHLIKVFNIVPTGIKEIRDQQVISDGVTNENLGLITTVKMAEYVGSMESFHRLWELTLSKVKFELNPHIDLDTVKENATPSIPFAGFCAFCDSKGVRHKKICPTLK